jgi:hypothetical protein
MHWIDPNWLNGSTIFFNIAVGVSTGAFVIIKTSADIIGDHNKRRVKKSIRKEFPRAKLGNGFLLVDTDEVPGKIYLIDIGQDTRRWIASSSTMQDLDFQWSDVQRISNDEFNKYKEGAAIFTSGVRGS